jgi:signal transduction histidine kinase
MTVSRTSPVAILSPLLVMLLMTLLVGWTGYRLTDAWRQSAEKTVHRLAQAVLLTTIRGNLEQVRREWPERPAQARTHWNEVRQQVNLLAQNRLTPDRASGAGTSRFPALEAFMAQDGNIARVDTLLREDFPKLELVNPGRELEALGAHSAFVTLAVTVCMLGLGGLLTLITAWDLSRLLRALIRSRDLNIRLQEEERRRIAGELHDGVMQDLVDLKRHYHPDKLDAIVNNLRRVCQNLKPQALADLGLLSALESLADDLRQAGVPQVQMNLDAEGLARLPKAFELPLFRVVQELFSNIRRHAGASQVMVTLVYNPAESRFLQGYIGDNGRGFSLPPGREGGMGLTGVRERIGQLGGTLQIDSRPGQGSRFRFRIPIPAEARSETTQLRTNRPDSRHAAS